jgi:hypothetical protein
LFFGFWQVRVCQPSAPKDKGNGVVAEHALWHPTHRNVRDGWGTRSFVEGEKEQAKATTAAGAEMLFG